jgi:hypothetical protein
MLKGEFCTEIQRILSTVNAKCFPTMTYAKNFCLTYAWVLTMAVSGDGCCGSYHSGQKLDEKIGVPWRAFPNGWVSYDMSSLELSFEGYLHACKPE